MFSDGRYKPSGSICSGLVICLSWIAATSVGCQTQGFDAGRVQPKVFDPGEGPVNSIRLFTSPVLFNLDGEPGLDAFKARVYAVRDSVPKPVPFTEGTLEIIIFENVHSEM